MVTKDVKRRLEIGKRRKESGRRRGLGTERENDGSPSIEAQFPMVGAKSIDDQPVKIPFRSR